jgi:hypothetical protein
VDVAHLANFAVRRNFHQAPRPAVRYRRSDGPLMAAYCRCLTLADFHSCLSENFEVVAG